MIPGQDELWFLPLGGCGEIGMNLSLYGHDGHWLMVDCGVTFGDPPDTRPSGCRVQMADPAFIAQRREQLVGLLLTHGHEDHIGAVAWLWPQLRCPVYATGLTAELLRRKLREHGLEEQVEIHLVSAGDRHAAGVFDVEWVPHTHSIPDPCGLMIRSPAGSVFHSADWKLDPEPQIGHHFQTERYQALGDSGVDTLVCDSTCALVDGHSRSEGSLYAGLLHHIQPASGRVVVACFGSNLARLHTLARVADATGRHLGLLGRSLLNNLQAARCVGLWQRRDTLVDPDHLGYLPPHTVLLVATGSQGEPRTALNRLSHDSLRSMSLQPGDTVIFSARAIPGNEADIGQMCDRLRARGVSIITPESAELPIHASGHPGIQELQQMYRWLQPRCLIPVHGESDHLVAQSELARAAGIPTQLLGRNGDLFMLAPNVALRRQAVPTGRIGVTPAGKMRVLPSLPTA